MYIIYSLLDPDTNEIRYIGKTTEKRKSKRLNEHIRGSSKLKNKKDYWINKLLKKGKKPIMEVIELISLDLVDERESYWISQFANLTNLTSGGEKSYQITEELREKLRLINSGENNPCYGRRWSDAERKKLSDINKGRTLSESQKTKIGESLSKKISINGVIYKSITFASKELHMSKSTIISNLRDINNDDWFYL